MGVTLIGFWASSGIQYYLTPTLGEIRFECTPGVKYLFDMSMSDVYSDGCKPQIGVIRKYSFRYDGQ